MGEYTEQRNRDFMAAFRREKRSMFERGEEMNVERIIARVMERPAPGYYVSYRYARRAVGDLMERGVIERYHGGVRRHSRRDMMIEIGRKCLERMYTRGMNLGEALTDVLVSEPASSFFMTRAYARQLFYRMCKESKRDKLHNKPRESDESRDHDTESTGGYIRVVGASGVCKSARP